MASGECRTTQAACAREERERGSAAPRCAPAQAPLRRLEHEEKAFFRTEICSFSLDFSISDVLSPLRQASYEAYAFYMQQLHAYQFHAQQQQHALRPHEHSQIAFPHASGDAPHTPSAFALDAYAAPMPLPMYPGLPFLQYAPQSHASATQQQQLQAQLQSPQLYAHAPPAFAFRHQAEFQPDHGSPPVGRRHSSAAASGSARPQTCRYFNLPGGCKRADKCHFAHVHLSAAQRSPHVSDAGGAPSPGSLSPVSSVSSTGSSGGGGGGRRRSSVLDAARQAERDAELSRQLAELETLAPNQLFELLDDTYALHYLMDRIEGGDARLVAALVADIGVARFAALATDRALNVFCQKLIEQATHAQRRIVLDGVVAASLAGAARNLHGTRVVQKLVDCAKEPDEVATLAAQLQAHVVELACDVNGNHVVQRCLAALAGTGGNQFVYDALASGDAVATVATHRHGCNVLQRCIDHASAAQQTQLRGALVRHFVALAQSPFGNYVAQYALERDAARLSVVVARDVQARMCELSSQRYGSNVVEKLLRVAPVDTRQALIDALIAQRDALAQLAQDSFGNYVLQTAISLCSEVQRRAIAEQLAPLMPSLRKTAFGKRIQHKLAAAPDASNDEQQPPPH
jgi:hypothetical protein